MKIRALRGVALAAALGAAAFAGGCSGDRDGAGTLESSSTTAIDRFIIGEAAAYPADRYLQRRFEQLKSSQAERRKTAWAIVQKAIEPVGVDDGGKSLPRFQTWFGKDEIVPMFEHILLSQTEEERRAHTPPTPALLEETFAWAAKRATSLPTFSEERLAKRRSELATPEGTSSLGGQERVLMSPTLVGHLLTHYDAMIRCIGSFPAAADPPPSETNFAPCVGEEFPVDAVVVKARWLPNTLPVAVADTSAAGLTAALGTGQWPESTRAVSPGADSIYTMRVNDTMTSRLVALHIASKELRDWMWISLFWSDEATSDFGADRPAELSGPWGGYKMCSVVDYDEGDDGSNDGALDGSLAGALAATRGFGTRSWCSNPYLEQGPHNAKTNCIGCHQHGGTDLTTTTILEGPTAIPDGSRGRVRENFPADYTFITSSGLELASRIRAKLDQIVPPAPVP